MKNFHTFQKFKSSKRAIINKLQILFNYPQKAQNTIAFRLASDSLQYQYNKLHMDPIKANTKILITVGTTQFDQLLVYTSSQSFLTILKQCGYSKNQILYQIGTTGKFVPQNSNYFRLNDKIQQIYSSHEIIVTHGGAGTLLACLHDPQPGKKIIAVANNSLSGNHQIQLVKKLHQEEYILGFLSIQEFAKDQQAVKQYISGHKILKKYEKPQKSILNKLLFDDQN